MKESATKGKKTNSIRGGGLRSKIFKLCIMLVITAICCFAILEILHLSTLLKMVNDTGKEQAVKIKEYSEDSMMILTEANMEDLAFQAADNTDWEIWSMTHETMILANQVKAWLDAGEYGEIESAYFNYHLRSMGYAPRVADPNLAGGTLLDIGIYGLTYAYRLFGKPEKIRCLGDLQGGVDTGERISLYYPGGRVFTVDSSIVNLKGLERMVLQGTEGSTSLWFFHGPRRVKLKRKGAKSLVFKGDGSYLNEFDIVSSEIWEGLKESRCVPHQATLDVMEMMDECRRQMHLVYPFEKEKEEEKDQEK